MQIYRSMSKKTNHSYLREFSGKHTLGESTPPNHRRWQLNGLLHSTPELDHQPCTRTARHFLAALNLESVTSSHDGLIKKIEECSTIILPMHNTASNAIPVHPYK